MLSQSKFVLSQSKFVLSQSKFVLSQSKFVLSQSKFVLSQGYFGSIIYFRKIFLDSIYNVSGDAGDSLAKHNGMKFSTKDRDNDLKHGGSCAQRFQGAWWYNRCHDSNLNGLYHGGHHKSYADGVNWEHWHGDHYSLQKTEMKIRPSKSWCMNTLCLIVLNTCR